MPRALISLIALLAFGCQTSANGAPGSQPAAPTAAEGSPLESDTPPPGKAIATFAGGCFWCMESPFDTLPGVEATISGYTDGDVPHATYKQVSRGGTGHTEALRIVYDPRQISYEELLYVFWRNIDPTQKDRQFCDRGDQYRSGIYYHDETQKALAEKTRDAIAKSGRLPGPIVTEVDPATPFYRAEEYHQDFYKKQPQHYYRYRLGCGRDQRLTDLWGDEAGGKKRP